MYSVQENVGNLLCLCFCVLIIEAIRLKLMKSNFYTFFIIYKAMIARAFFLLSVSNVSTPGWMDFCPDTSGSFSWSTRMLLMGADFFFMGTAVWPEVYCHVVFLNLAKGSQLLLVMTHLILLSALLHRSVLITINLDLESRLLSGGCRWDRSVNRYYIINDTFLYSS